MSRSLPPSLALAIPLAVPSVALACPDCDVSRTARATVLGDPNLLSNLMLLALPVVIVALIAAALYRIGHPAAAVHSGRVQR